MAWYWGKTMAKIDGGGAVARAGGTPVADDAARGIGATWPECRPPQGQHDVRAASASMC